MNKEKILHNKIINLQINKKFLILVVCFIPLHLNFCGGFFCAVCISKKTVI